MAIIKTRIEGQGSLIEYEFSKLKAHDYTSSIGLNLFFFRIDKDDKNNITRIVLPWFFYLFDGGTSFPVYTVRKITICDIEDANKPITKDQLVETIKSSYNSLYADIKNDPLLYEIIMSLPDFSPNSFQWEQNIQSALKIVGKHVFL